MYYIYKIILKTFIFPPRSQLPCGPICLQIQATLLSSPWYLCTSSWSSSPAHNHYSRVRIWCHVSQVTCHDMVSVHLCSKIILQAARAGSVTLVEVHLWVNCNVLEKSLQYIQYLRQVLHWLWRGLSKILDIFPKTTGWPLTMLPWLHPCCGRCVRGRRGTRSRGGEGSGPGPGERACCRRLCPGWRCWSPDSSASAGSPGPGLPSPAAGGYRHGGHSHAFRGCPYITSAAITRQGKSECLQMLT